MVSFTGLFYKTLHNNNNSNWSFRIYNNLRAHSIGKQLKGNLFESIICDTHFSPLPLENSRLHYIYRQYVQVSSLKARAQEQISRPIRIISPWNLYISSFPFCCRLYFALLYTHSVQHLFSPLESSISCIAPMDHYSCPRAGTTTALQTAYTGAIIYLAKDVVSLWARLLKQAYTYPLPRENF